MRANLIGMLVAALVNMSSTFVTYDDDSICGKMVYMGILGPAVEIAYYSKWYQNQDHTCTATIQIPPSYYGAVKLRSIDGSCSSYLRIEQPFLTKIYRFCRSEDHHEISISPNTKITLEIENKGQYVLYNQFNMLVYIYKYNNADYGCDSPYIMCNNGRCIDRQMFCYTDFNFCTDGTLRDCYSDLPAAGTPLGNIIGIVALVMTLILVFVVLAYFCCYRKNRDNRSSSSRNNRRQPRTARDVYTIPTSEDNPDGIDYVIDYQKFAAPPAYETLEMTVISPQNAHAHVDDSSGSGLGKTEQSDRQLESDYSTIVDIRRSDDDYDGETLNTQVPNSGASNGVQNEGFDSSGDFLPSYSDVVSSRR